MAAKTRCGRTVSNIQRKGIPNDGSSYGKTARPETCADTGTNNKFEPEQSKVYEMGHNVSVLSEGKQAGLWTQFCG